MRRRSAVLVLALALAGCSGSVGVSDELAGDNVAKQVSDSLVQQTGQTPDKVDCPDDLSTKKGSTTRCTLTAGSTRVGVTVTVSGEKKGTTVPLSFEVDERPMP